MADYSVSSQAAEADWKGNNNLYANTENKVLKQRLDEHLVGVAAQALKILRRLPQFTKHMETARDVRSLRKKSPPPFGWQDKAVEKIEDLSKESCRFIRRFVNLFFVLTYDLIILGT